MLRALIVRRHYAPGCSMSEDCLRQVAKDITAKGSIAITDPVGGQHQVTLHTVEVTETGIEATFDLDLSTINQAR